MPCGLPIDSMSIFNLSWSCSRPAIGVRQLWVNGEARGDHPMKWSIGRKIGLAFASSVMLLVLVIATSYLTLRGLTPAGDDRRRGQEAQEVLDQMSPALMSLLTASSGYLETPDEKREFIEAT